jgi:TRAP-type C4-dicarboxylate transport system permease small subunit
MDTVPWRKKSNFLDKALEVISMGILVVMVAEVGFSVFCRYVLNVSFRWSEEVTVILFVYLIFLAVPIVLKQRMHICIDYFVAKFPTKVCKTLNIIVDLIILVVSCILMATSVQVLLHIGKEPMSATHLPIGIIYGAVGLSGFLICIVTVRLLLKQLRTAPGCEDPHEGNE